MTLPHKVRIGSRDYRVLLRPREKLAVAKNYAGFFCADEGIIYIVDDINTQEQFNTLLHEIIHAINYEIDHKMDEQHVERMSRVLACVLRDNILKPPR